MQKPEPVTAAELGIEPVTHFRSAADPYTSREPRVNGGGARLVPISLARVRWLERPVDGVEEEAEND